MEIMTCEQVATISRLLSWAKVEIVAIDGYSGNVRIAARDLNRDTTGQGPLDITATLVPDGELKFTKFIPTIVITQ